MRVIIQKKGSICQILIIFSFIIASHNSVLAAAAEITINKNPIAIGHYLYYGLAEDFSESEKQDLEKIDLGEADFYVVSNLQEGSTYYFAATAYDNYGNESVFSDAVSYKVPEYSFLIPRDNWSLVYVDCEEVLGKDGRAVNAFDGNPDTIWHTEWKNNQPKHPHEIQIDLGATYQLESFSYLPRQDGCANGRIKDYAFYVSNDPMDWGDAAASGTFADSMTEKTVLFGSRAVGRFIRLVALNEVNGQPFTSVAEINVVGTVFTNEEITKDSTLYIIEIGEVFVDHNWQRVDFERTFIHPIVVAKPASLNDPDPAVVRISSADETGFDIRIQEWDYLDDVHDFENVSYMVVEKGSYILPGGIMMEAGTFEADGQSFLFKPFVESFNHIPVVLASITSANQETAVDGRINNVSVNGFEYLLQEQELNNQRQYGVETVSFIALESFSGVLKGLTIEVGTTSTEVGDNFHYISYTENFLTVPHFFADMQTVHDLDTSNVRYLRRDLYGVEVHISEEQSTDAELIHSNENVGYIIIAE